MTSRLVLVTRPRPDADRTAEAVRGAGFEPIVAPLMRIAPRDGALARAPQADAAAITSASGARAYAGQGGRLPVFAVGPASTEAAREAGLRVVGTAGGDVASLAELIAAARPARVLHAGGARLAGDLAGDLARRGVPCARVMLYEAREAERLPEAAVRAIREGLAWTLLFSPRSAALFERLVRAAGLQDCLRRSRLAALSPAVAAACSLPFEHVAVAGAPEHSRLVDFLSAPSS